MFKVKFEANKVKWGRWTKCIKNQPCDVIKMRQMTGEVGKKTPKKEMDFYGVTKLNFGQFVLL